MNGVSGDSVHSAEADSVGSAEEHGPAPIIRERGIDSHAPKQLVWQCGIFGAKSDRFGFWSLSRALEQPVRAVPLATGRCDPDRSLRLAPSGPADTPGLPDPNWH